MAKKRGYYSPKAIQARQQVEVDEYNRQRDAAKKAQEQQQQAERRSQRPPTGTATGGMVATPTPPPQDVPQSVPWLAKNVDKFGNPWFGDGFKGWVRRTFAYAFDKGNFKINPQVEAEVKSVIDDRAREFNRFTAWDSWADDVFGLSSREIVEGVSNLGAAGRTDRQEIEEQDLGAVEKLGRAAEDVGGVMKRAWLGNIQGAGAIFGGLNVLGADDTLMRKLHATTLATSNILQEENKGREINPIFSGNFAHNTGSMIARILKGDVKWGDVEETYERYWKGSQMVYTMVFQDGAMAEFNRQVDLGRDPGLVAQELGNPGIEIAGSILGSPSTYFGMGIPMAGKLGLTPEIAHSLGIIPEARKAFLFWGKTKTAYRLPTFGEFFKIGAGATRLRQAGSVLDDVSHIDGFDDAVRNMAKVTDDAAAEKLLDEVAGSVSRAVKRAGGQVDELAGAGNKTGVRRMFENVVAYTNHSKVSVTTREARGVIANVLKNADSVDDAVAVLSDMARLARNSDDKEIIARLLKQGRLPFSEPALRTGSILADMEEELAPLVARLRMGKGVDALEVSETIYKSMSRVVSERIPSVEDMRLAKKAERAGTASPAQKILAGKYNELPAYLRVTEGVHNKMNHFRSLGINLMANVYMNLSGGYFNRNIMGQGINILADLGMPAALEISASAYRGIDGVVGSTKWTDAVLTNVTKQIEDLLGYLPEGALRGIGDQIGNLRDAGKKGFLSAAQNAERITSAEIILRSAKNELLKAIPAAIQGAGWDELAKALPREQRNLLYTLLMDNFGNFDNALRDFKRMAGSGEIEAWRVTAVPKKLKSFLSDMHRGDALNDLLRNAKTPDEFSAGIKKIVSDLDEQAAQIYKERQTVGSLSDAAVRELVVTVDEIEGAAGEMFNRKVMYWENARNQLKEAVNIARDSINRKIGRNPQLSQAWDSVSKEIQAIQDTEMEFYRTNNGIRELVRKLYKSESDNVAELADSALFGRAWSLKADFPDADWAAMTRADFNELLWKSYFKTSGEGWTKWNISFFDGQMSKLDEFSKTFFGQGMDATVTAFKGDDNPFKIAFEYRKIAQKIDETDNLLRGLSVEELAKTYDIKPQAILNTINKYRAQGTKAVNNVTEITPEMARGAFETRRIQKGLPLLDMPPAAYNGEQPTFARSLFESMPGVKRDLLAFEESVVGEWGKTAKTLPSDIDALAAKFGGQFKGNMKAVTTRAGEFANQMRDYILHDYEKTNLDLAMSYLMPFQYWTTRTYARWMERLVENPKYAHYYMLYKDYMAKKHADLPEFWRQNVGIPALPGITDHPLFFNLEATLNPLYGLVGSDFNDPYKRVDWVSSVVDDMNKMGPTLAPAYNWAVALHLYHQGQDDAAQRWMGRLLPQTAFVKSVLNRFGANVNIGPVVKNNEFDPFVNLLMGGLDPYERNRVARTLAGLVGREVMIDGQPVVVTEEMTIDASNAQDGELWDYAVRDALNERFWGQTFSFFAGVGFKSRTEGDIKVDQFYGEYHKLLAARELMTPEAYRQAWDDLREKHPYMDTILIGKKSGGERDTAFSYNVLSRIPPGELNDIAALVGVEPYMVQSFYDNKGDISKMTPQDQMRWRAAMLDLAAILAMPDGATREEWTAAKSTYQEMNGMLKTEYGDDIIELINEYYDTPEAEREDFLQAFPEVQQAMDRKTELVANTPILAAYYNGLDTVERYYINGVNIELEKEYGENIDDIVTRYYAMKDNLQNAEAKKLEREYRLKQYFADKKRLMAEADTSIIEAAKNIPEGRKYTIRPEFQSQSGIQERTEGYAGTNQQAALAQNIWNELSPAAQTLVREHFETGEELPQQVKRQIEYIAERYDISQYDAMRLLGIEIVE